MSEGVSVNVATFRPLLASTADASALHPFLRFLTNNSSSIPQPKIQTYPDVTYHTYPTLGLSLTYLPSYSPSNLIIDRIDIFNPLSITPQPTRKRALPPSPFPRPLHLIFPTTNLTLPTHNDQPPRTITRPKRFDIRRDTTGREFVDVLGEPSKKGGGEGWMGVWLEWGCVELELEENGDGDEGGERKVVKVGLMVELRDGGKEPDEEDMKKGMGGVWDKAAKWEWAGLKVFRAEEQS